eukprot:7127283-Prymnesium_polylepis.2
MGPSTWAGLSGVLIDYRGTSYLRTRKGVKGYLREDTCSVGVAETLSLVGVQHIVSPPPPHSGDGVCVGGRAPPRRPHAGR